MAESESSPMQMAAAALAVASLAGTATAAKGQIDAGNAQRAAAYENAVLLEEDAKQSKVSVADRISGYDLIARRMYMKQRAGAAKSGVDMTGSPLDVMRESLDLAEKDVMSMYRAGEYESARYMRSAEIMRRTGSTAQAQSRWAAAGTLIGGIGNLGMAAAYGKSGFGVDLGNFLGLRSATT